MHLRRFRFGVTSYGAGSGTEWIEKARRVEALGYSTLLMSDHFMGQMSAVPALAAAATATSRLRIGTIVCDNDFRHPILLAKEAATIDFVSGGRFELSIGAGWLKAEHDALGIPFDAPGTRVARLEESVRIIKDYFSEQLVNFSGKYYQVSSEKGLDKIPAPVQRPRIPILIGGGGKRMLELAGREADIAGITLKIKPDGTRPDPSDAMVSLAEKIGWIRESAGDRFSDIELSVQTWMVIITEEREVAARELEPQFGIPAETLLALPFVLIGSEAEIAARLEEHRERYGISYYSVFDRDMEAFAPISARLAG